MANTGLELGMEVPVVTGSAKAGASSTAAHSSHTRSVNIPSFVDEAYDEWVVSRLVKVRMNNYEAMMGKVKNPFWRQVLLDTFREMERKEQESEERELHWSGAPKKGKGKGVTFFMDVPYKHSGETGEVFEGPVSSHCTFEKAAGEDLPVYYNPGA